MNTLVKKNLRESAVIAVVSASVVAATATANREEPSAVTVVAEAGIPVETINSFIDEIVKEKPVVVVPEIPLLEDRDITFSERDLFCLQQNIYYEARGEEFKDQRAVAWVTLNRVEHEVYPDTVCEVVWQPSQFSWTRHTVEAVPRFRNEIERNAWKTSKKIARDVMAKFKMNFPDPTKGADHYHADYANPMWADATKMTAQAGAHVFYKLY